MAENVRQKNAEKQRRFREKMKDAGYRRITTYTNIPGKVPSRTEILKPEKCSMCGKETKELEFHHSDYAKPLEGIWVCKPCHGVADKKRIELFGSLGEK